MSEKPVGMWINLEGIDGSGKTGAAEYIANTLAGKHRKVVVLKGLGTGLLGKAIRASIFSGYLSKNSFAIAKALALMDCYEHVKENLDKGNLVITDRFIGSYRAYDVIANNDSLASYIFIDKFTNFIKPNIEILLDIDPNEAKSRIKVRAGETNFIDDESLAYFDKVREGFNKHFSSIENGIIINNNKSIKHLKSELAKTLKDKL